MIYGHKATLFTFYAQKSVHGKEDNETRTKEAVAQERGGLMRRKGWGTCTPRWKKMTVVLQLW